MWRVSVILEACSDAVRAMDDRLRAEQAVHGVDAINEIGLHPVLSGGLIEAGFGVEREVVYPGEHTARVRRSARNRCDLVLLPQPGQKLQDPAEDQAELIAGEDTLFRDMAHRMDRRTGGVRPADACWLEVKSVAQHAYVDGVPMPNRAYADQLVKGPMADLIKLASDPSIWTGAAVVLLFCVSEDVGLHDLNKLAHRLLDEGVPLGAPEIGGVRIEDRVGNAWCGIGVFPTRA